MKRYPLAAAILLSGVWAAAQVLSVGILEDITTTNVWAVFGPEASVWNTYVLGGEWESLYASVPPVWAWLPQLAADFPSNFVQQPDGTWAATVPLRWDITWSDGTPFTADDVVFTYNVILALGAENLGGNWPSYAPDSLVAVNKVNNYAVEFVFSSKPGLGEWNFGTLYCPIVQKAYWEPYFQAALRTSDPADSLLTVMPVGEPVLGRYELYRWIPGVSVQVNSNPTYYAAGETTTFYEGGGAIVDNPNSGYHFEAYGGATEAVKLSLTDGPFASSILYHIYPDQDAAVSALQSGGIAFFLSPQGLRKGFRQRLEATPNVAVISNPPWGFRYLAFNMRREPMSYKAFRVAVATLIDREYMANTVFQGDIIPMYSVVPHPNPFWYNPDIVVYGQGMDHFQRVEEAVKVLKKAGFSWDAEPVVVDKDNPRNTRVAGKLPDSTIVDEPSGFKLPNGEYCPELELLAPSAGYDPLRATFALYIEQWCREIGLPVKANLTGFNVIVNKVWAPDGFNFDMYILGWSLGDPSFPDYLYYFWHSSQDVPDGFNTPGYRNPEFDKLAEDFLAAANLETARELVFRMQEMLAEDVPYVILFDTPIDEAYNTNLIIFPYTEVLGGIQFVWPP